MAFLKLIKMESVEERVLSEALSSRRLDFPEELVEQVQAIIEDVRKNGDHALCQYTRKFDCPDFGPELIRVDDSEIERAFDQVDKGVLSALEKARRNIEAFHKRQVPNSWFETKENGAILGQVVRPVDRAGLYVPGGTGGNTPLVSSVLMNGIPAAIAGVKDISLCTPPGRGGLVSPYLLVAASLAGVKRIYRLGSAWAVAALAFGTETVLPVDVIAGPGNIFVTIAKKIISGSTGIDMVAGPSEILVIADDSADARFVAADLLSQAEHDEMATSILVTTSQELLDNVEKELELQLQGLSRGETARKSLVANGLAILVTSLEDACRVSNFIGPEHLELMVEDPWGLVPFLKHAGAIFLGKYTPEPIGDYIAGPNHVLPTMGTARFSSALGVDTFLKRTSLISYSRDAFLDDADDVIKLAETEGLGAHANSVRVRLQG